MTAQLEGWYPDPYADGADGAVRYWDGQAWTPHSARPLSDAEREEKLSAAVREWVYRGAKVESHNKFQAVVVTGNQMNHGAHLIAIILTCGVWLVFWLLWAIFQTSQRRTVLIVDKYGNVTSQDSLR